MFGQTAEFPHFGTPADRAWRWPATRRRMGIRLLLIALGFAIGVVTHAAARPTRRSDSVPPTYAARVVASLDDRISHNGVYHAEAEPGAPIRIGVPQTWTIRLTRRNQRRVGSARIAAQVWMPETGQRSPVAPAARYIGNGTYRLDGIYFSRAGWWNVALVVEGRGGVDSVAFNVDLPSLVPAAAP
jgi:hypothetical protein